MCNNQLAMKVMLLIGSITWDEFWIALPKAHAKLFRIVQREGDAGGARLTIDYAVMLIAEQIIIDRMMTDTLGGATNGRSDYHNKAVADNRREVTAYQS
jgi:hypothetical protein